MGWIKNNKVAMMRGDAGKARAEGRMVFACKLNYPALKPDLSGEIVDWSMMIEAVESEGWTLVNFAGGSDKQGRPEALCLFRPS
ncbi:hypothetical protein [Stackebrandtia nassauensis]|uniref:DUF4177 domain-containing protein n=1 Tax=Stackebrandtia nassauensis (strain DSM 44728 / CIP 108903 / NRRL B-16338 / NBRC 102104 / LLR-40K-21) TaxID=446470 RepID=D3Q243_STANL|nr:hypothetical protein [Stackebrandtia nassauensis]ADD41910.1 hypothetical protein Snas_2220 [Stackebrandtia nassauensis DSM 44728]